MLTLTVALSLAQETISISSGTGALADVPPLALAPLALVCVAVGALLGVKGYVFLEKRAHRRNKARWPGDWPKASEMFSRTPQPTKPGYLSLAPSRAMGSGAMPLGRTYPRWSLIPDIYPLREMRRRFEYLFSKPVWVPYKKRFQHVGILGGTGKGKSAAFAIPILAYGAHEKNTSTLAIDVKSPSFLRMFARLYRNAGKDVVFFDPFSDETLAFEPVWRASEKSLDIIADVICNYSAEPGQMQSSENSEFFKLGMIRLMRSMLSLAQYWPRRYCNLPSIQQLVGAGGNAIKEAFVNSKYLFPSMEQTCAAIEVVLRVEDASEARGAGRDELLEGALTVLDRSGYEIARSVFRMRRFEIAHREGGIDAAKIEDIREQFWGQIKVEWQRRKDRLDDLLVSLGEFISGPDDTRNSIVMTLANKVGQFREPNLAKAFSREEMDIGTLVKRPCLYLVGAPMYQKDVGALFVASLITNLAINAVYERGAKIEAGEKVPKHGVFFMLDEFPQLGIKKAPNILATFRGFLSGLIMVYQERGQWKQGYGEDATTMEGNTIHQVLMQGAHPTTAKYYADDVVGEVQITKRSKSGVKGEKTNVSESVETVPLMSANDLIGMKLNGRPKPEMAMSVGSDVPPFPLRPSFYFKDPHLRKLLGLSRVLDRGGNQGKEFTWKFWEWDELWVQQGEARRYLTRRTRASSSERGASDPVSERRNDPYTQFLDFLFRDNTGFDELVPPRLDLKSIGVIQNDPNTADQGGAQKAAPAASAPAKAAPEVPMHLLLPPYGLDLRTLINDDLQAGASLPESLPAGGSIRERLDGVVAPEEDT